ncbi:MAG: hypothetical protein ABIO78_04810 [Thermoanaerobaculia bacterium]
MRQAAFCGGEDGKRVPIADLWFGSEAGHDPVLADSSDLLAPCGQDFKPLAPLLNRKSRPPRTACERNGCRIDIEPVRFQAAACSLDEGRAATDEGIDK